MASVLVSTKNSNKKVCNADCTALRVWNVKRASFLLGSVPLGPNFTGTGRVVPCQNVDTIP